MGASHGEFVKYPRTPHLFGSAGTVDDKHFGPDESSRMLIDPSLIVEEKLDGTNVGLHFGPRGDLILQCRGHLITEGMHPQYDLLKQWTATKHATLEGMLGDRYLLFGEWVYAHHSIPYRRLPHYFFEFDIYDKERVAFLDLATRLSILEGTGIATVPVIHRGTISRADLDSLIGPSRFDSRFDNPLTGATSASTRPTIKDESFRRPASGVGTCSAKAFRSRSTPPTRSVGPGTAGSTCSPAITLGSKSSTWSRPSPRSSNVTVDEPTWSPRR